MPNTVSIIETVHPYAQIPIRKLCIIITIKYIYYSTLVSRAIQRHCTIKPFMPKYIKKILYILKSNLKKMCLQKRRPYRFLKTLQF